MTGTGRDRPLSEKAKDDLIAVAVIDREGRARRQGKMAPDNRIASHEAALDVDQVHRAPLALTQTGAAAEELRHDGFGIASARQAMAVIAVRGKDIVIGPERIHSTDGHGFFADIQMAEAADLPEGIHLRAPLFEAADQQHLSIEV